MPDQLNLLKVTSYYDLDFTQRNQVLLAISKPSAFFTTFYNQLPFARTNIECFNKLNDLHFDIWGQYMYSSYNSFQIVYKKHTTSKSRK